MRIFILLLLCVTAHADVIVCTDQTCAATTAKPKDQVLPDDRVRFCLSGSTNGAQVCTVQDWYRWAGMQEYSWTLTTDGWYQKKDIPTTVAAPAYVPYTYKCKPKSEDSIFKAKRGDDIVELWYCDTATGVFPQYFCHAASRTPDGLYGSLVAIFSSLKPSRNCTASEKQLVEDLHIAKGVKIKVATNGTTTTRPIYAVGPGNTRGAVVTDRATVGYYCGWKRLQNTDGTPTNYFQYGDKGYTLCTVSGVTTK